MKRPPGMYPKFDAETVTMFRKTRQSNKTGYLGVKWRKKEKVYQAYIRVHGKKEKLYCGQAKTAEEAAKKIRRQS